MPTASICGSPRCRPAPPQPCSAAPSPTPRGCRTSLPTPSPSPSATASAAIASATARAWRSSAWWSATPSMTRPDSWSRSAPAARWCWPRPSASSRSRPKPPRGAGCGRLRPELNQGDWNHEDRCQKQLHDRRRGCGGLLHHRPERRRRGSCVRHRLIVALGDYLFREQGFHGNNDDYYDPRNSFLNDVLDRRTGIPITLSTVYMEVGRRLGLCLHGVGMPGHFLVKYVGPDEEIVIDPFNEGAIVSSADCQRILDRIY